MLPILLSSSLSLPLFFDLHHHWLACKSNHTNELASSPRRRPGEHVLALGPLGFCGATWRRALELQNQNKRQLSRPTGVVLVPLRAPARPPFRRARGPRPLVRLSINFKCVRPPARQRLSGRRLWRSCPTSGRQRPVSLIARALARLLMKRMSAACPIEWRKTMRQGRGRREGNVASETSWLPSGRKPSFALPLLERTFAASQRPH